jgi:hypothetical protein
VTTNSAAVIHFNCRLECHVWSCLGSLHEYLLSNSRSSRCNGGESLAIISKNYSIEIDRVDRKRFSLQLITVCVCDAAINLLFQLEIKVKRCQLESLIELDLCNISAPSAHSVGRLQSTSNPKSQSQLDAILKSFFQVQT